jgi:hypothetical protein
MFRTSSGRLLNGGLTTSRFFQSLRHKTTNISFITDTEGTRYFIESVLKSNIVGYEDGHGLVFKRTHGTPHFIFGGDATDRGSHDLMTTELLVNFKEKYPEQVTLLAGNRDIKNNRFKIELHPGLIRQRLLYSKPARWLPVDKQSVPKDYLKKYMVDKGLDKLEESLLVRYVGSLPVEECQLIYLHWMLETTMGSPNAFRYRREELMRRLKVSYLPDAIVLKSFLRETAPAGLMGRYLQLSQLAVIVPDTRVMAVHGGITAANVGRVPGMQESAHIIRNARTWVEYLNEWYSRQIRHWMNFESAALTEPACLPLDEAVLPMPNKTKYVVTADMLSNSRQFNPVAAEVSQYLIANKISVVLTGHQPCGDHPLLLRGGDNLLFINGDTSYAGFRNSTSADDTRGGAWHRLEINADGGHTRINLKAVMSDMRGVETSISVTPSSIIGDPLVGQILPDHSVVQTRDGGDKVRLVRQEGFEVKYTGVAVAEVEVRLRGVNVDDAPRRKRS